MKTKLLLIAVLLMTSNFGSAQTTYKEIKWEEVGLKFKVPSFIEVKSQDDESMKLESEDYLMYVELVDDFDSLDELLANNKVKKVVNRDENIDEKTFHGKAVAGFIKSEEEGDNINQYNVFGNLESKFNKKEKISFDIGTYEFDEEIQNQLNEIMGSVQFYQIDSAKPNERMFSSKNSSEDTNNDDANVSN